MKHNLLLHRARVYESAVVLIGAAILFNELDSTKSIHSRLWPLLIVGSMCAVTLLSFFNAVFFSREKVARTEKSSDDQEGYGRYLLMALYSSYIISVPWLGFLLATVMFIPLAGWVLRMPMRLLNISIAVIIGLSVYLLFEIGFNIPLPSGFIDFSELY